MSCCGKQRERMRLPSPSTRRTILSRQATKDQVAAFEYVGKTALTAIGPASGRHYRFSYPGAIVEVDPRDRASLASVPNLRQIVND
jgi:hypothetical protein